MNDWRDDVTELAGQILQLLMDAADQGDKEAQKALRSFSEWRGRYGFYTIDADE